MVLEAGLVVAVTHGVVQPGRALVRRLAVERGVDPGRDGRRRPGRGAPRCRRCGTSSELGLSDCVGGRQPVGGRARPAGARRTPGCRSSPPRSRARASTAALIAADVAGQVVEVADRGLECRPRGGRAWSARRGDAGDGAGTAGEHHGDRDVGRSTSGSSVSVTTSGPTRSAYHSPRRSRRTPRPRRAGRRSPVGRSAASSTRPVQAAGRGVTQPANHVRPRRL